MSARGRHGARRLLLQALYQHLLAGHSVDDLVAQFSESPGLAGVDDTFFLTLLAEIIASADELDAHIVAVADRPVEQLDPVERAVLWIGLVELTRHPEVPVRVVIDEAIQLAREFGAEASFRYINAVLDKASGTLRPAVGTDG